MVKDMKSMLTTDRLLDEDYNLWQGQNKTLNCVLFLSYVLTYISKHTGPTPIV